jgi:hypothetical protein
LRATIEDVMEMKKDKSKTPNEEPLKITLLLNLIPLVLYVPL